MTRRIKRSSQEIVLLSLALLAVMTISPFALLRWFNGDIAHAIANGVISLTSIIFFMFIFITRKIAAAQKIFAVFLSLATLLIIYFKGESLTLWVFPSIIAIYYLMPLSLARITSTALVLSVAIVIYPKVELIPLLTIIATTTLTTALSFVIFRAHDDKQKELSLLASIDPLTASGNRRALDLKLSEIIASQQREAYTMCLILIDLDDFKEINDIHGHAAGDLILVSVCELIVKHTRALDSLYRYGGDEFIIMPVNMNLKTTRKLAEKVRELIESHVFTRDIKLTLSIGTSEYKAQDTPESWISRADAALYQAKNIGRNSVC